MRLAADELGSPEEPAVKPRLRHVAELAGVSEATVSRVVNDRPGVSEATRSEVLRALQQLGYEPVGLGRTRPRNGLVGLIVPELDNPVFPRFAQTIESQLAREGATTVLCTSTPAGMREADYLDVLLDQGASGIIIISGEPANTESDLSRYTELAARGIPTVVVNGAPAELPVPTVTVDHETAAARAVAHLAALGHDRIGLAVGPQRYIPSLAMVAGYRRGLADAGLDADDRLLAETLYGIEGGHAAGQLLLDASATGIVCASDRMALGVIRAVRERGIDVPADVSVVGFDDAGPNPYLDPPLTSLQQPVEAMCSAVVRLITGPPATSPGGAPPALRFRAELVVRGSTAPAPRLLSARDGATRTGAPPLGA